MRRSFIPTLVWLVLGAAAFGATEGLHDLGLPWWLTIQSWTVALALDAVLDRPRKRLQGKRLNWLRWALCHVVVGVLNGVILYSNLTIFPALVVLAFALVVTDHFIWERDEDRRRRNQKIKAMVRAVVPNVMLNPVPEGTR